MSLILALLPVACGDGGTTSGTSGSSSTSGAAAGGAGGASTGSSSSGSETTGSGGQGGSGGSGVCTPGITQACYEGPSGTLGIGVCKGGIKTCNAQGTAFGACAGQVLPSAETCATPGDDDCNGQVNEGGAGCSCIPGTTSSCYDGAAATLGVGPCKGGMHTCDALGKGYGPCIGQVLPQPETCATPIDDDCNLQVNEGGVGCVCAPNATVSCYTGPAGTVGVGTCKAGSQTCNAQGTALGACSGAALPQAEICGDALDNDCDGQVDEGCLCTPGSTAACYSGPAGTMGVGACKAGTHICSPTGDGYGACMGEVLPQAETCGTAGDDDCNGQANEICVCVPNAAVSCYTGPAGTSGVGICKGGSQVCNAQGTGYGACVGEVVPQAEQCTTPADEDCDGVTACSGAHLWSKAWGGSPDDEGNSLAVDASDNIIYAGYSTGPVDYGCGPLPVNPDVDAAVLMKLTPGGTCTWSKSFGSLAQMIGAVFDSSGNVLATGMFSAGINLGNGLVTTNGGSDAFVAKFDSVGNILWSKVFGDPSPQVPNAVATDAAGNLITYGYFYGTMDLGGGPLVSAGGADLYVAKFSPTGTLLWSKRFGDGGNQLARGLAVDASGNVLLTGSVYGTVNFGGATLTSAGLGDTFIAKLDPAGNHLWSKGFGNALDQVGTGVATDPAGDVYLSGYYNGSMTFGGGMLISRSGADSYLVKLDPSGNHLWSISGGGYHNQGSFGVAVDPAGNVAIVGIHNGMGSYGGPVLTTAGSTDILVAKYDSSGNYLWSKLFGDPAAQAVKGFTIDTKGNLLLTGLIMGPTDFGGGPIIAGGGEDTFIAKLGP